MKFKNHKIILGTVQFGLNYGINNQRGQPDADRVSGILDYAFAQGIRTLDSADAYGNAPEIIGRYHASRSEQFEIITKFKAGRDFVAEAWLNQQLEKFAVQSLYACLFHDFQDYQANRRVISEFDGLVGKGLVKKVGVSVYTNQQFLEAIQDERISLIQLPYNLLDNDFQRGALLARAKSGGKETHVRSVFLQGLFFMDLGKIPKKLASFEPELEELHQLSSQFNIPLESLALNYAMANENIDRVLIGVDSRKQLETNLSALHQTLPPEMVATVNRIKVKEVDLLNPTNWK